MNKADKDKVIAALEKAQADARQVQWDDGVEALSEALSIMRGLEDAEPCKHEWFRTGAAYSTGRACIHCGTWCGTSPQADQTEEALRDVVRQSEDMGLYDADFQTGRAGSKP